MTPTPIDYRIIPLTQGQHTLVDAEDYDRVMTLSWYANWSEETQTYYALAKMRRPDGKLSSMTLQRFILGLSFGDRRIGDHIKTTETLDNRKANLRIVSRGQSVLNRRMCKNNTCGYKGVHACRGKWRAQLTLGGQKKHLGYFNTPVAAHAAYCEAVAMYHGEYGNTGS